MPQYAGNALVRPPDYAEDPEEQNILYGSYRDIPGEPDNQPVPVPITDPSPAPMMGETSYAGNSTVTAPNLPSPQPQVRPPVNFGPLPEVAPNSAMVPYQGATRDPSGQLRYYSGWGRRAAPPMAPSAGAPDITDIYRRAYSQLPFEQAQKAVQAALQFQGMRAFQQEMASGKAPAQALANNAPMLFAGNPAAINAAMRGTTPQISRIPEGTIVGQRLYPTPRPANPPASIALVNEIEKANQAAAAAEARGDTKTAQALRERAEMLMSQAKGQEVVVESLPGGGTRTWIGKAGSSATKAAETQAEEKLAQFQNINDLVDWLNIHIRPEDVGVRGLLGEMVLDKAAAQINPEWASGERITGRQMIRFLNEGLLRKISDDATGRYTAADKEEAKAALISLGAIESDPDVKNKLAVVKDRFTKRAKVYSLSIGKKPPLWSLSDAELIRGTQAGQISLAELKQEKERRYPQ